MFGATTALPGESLTWLCASSTQNRPGVDSELDYENEGIKAFILRRGMTDRTGPQYWIARKLISA